MNNKQTEIPLGRRNNYFAGKLMTAQDFNDEQTYFRNRLRLHNQLLLRCGCVSVLKVSISKNKPASIIVHTGIAIDPQGNEIVLSSDVECPLPENPKMRYLVAYWAERGTDFIPGFGSGSEGVHSEPSRVEEYAILKYEENLDEAHRSGIVLARLKQVRGKWKIDEKFRRDSVKTK